jgi:hypothetical protein
MRMIPATVLALGAGAWLFGPAAARADNLDEALRAQAVRIMKRLQEDGHKNIGVLKFQVEHRGRKASLNVSRLNLGLATRLENALVLADPTDRPLGITRGASQVAAAQDKQATYLTPEGRRKLLALDYPLAWGSDKVKVDVFLTGTARVSPDMRQTEVVIAAFDRKAPDLRELARFPVATDRSLLADLNESFALSKRTLKRRGDLQDEEAVAVVAAQGQGKKTDATPVEELVEVQVAYDGKPAAAAADADNPGGKAVTPPRPGQKVTFGLKNKSGERLAVVLRVNGVNTLRKEADDREPQAYSMWVLEPGKEYVVRGFYPDSGTLETFAVLSDEASEQVELADSSRRGLIELALFREGGKDAENNPALVRRSISLRGVTPPAKDLAELRARLLRAGGAVGKMGLLMPGGKESVALDQVEFTSPQFAGELVIRYHPATK